MYAAVLSFLFFQTANALASAEFVFRDDVNACGRNLIKYRDVPLSDAPVWPLAIETDFPEPMRYGLLRIGSQSEDAISVIAARSAAGGIRIGVDVNRDLRIQRDECHDLTDMPLELLVNFDVPDDSPQRETVRRMLLIRRGTDDSAVYAMRGFTAGHLELAGTSHAAWLSDANADGLFGTPGVDRIWVDFNNDGELDAAAECFPLGRPLVLNQQKYVVAANPSGTAVQARLRPQETGNLLLRLLPDRSPTWSHVGVSLVSDIGEAVLVTSLDTPTPLPIGRYRVASLAVGMQGPSGELWEYWFDGDGPSDVQVEAGRTNERVLLPDLKLSVNVTRNAGVARLSVNPRFATPGLELTNCTIPKRGRMLETRSARISVMTGRKKSFATSGFA